MSSRRIPRDIRSRAGDAFVGPFPCVIVGAERCVLMLHPSRGPMRRIDCGAVAVHSIAQEATFTLQPEWWWRTPALQRSTVEHALRAREWGRA